MVKAGGTLIVVLPGVPPEMEAIFIGSLKEIIKSKAGKFAFFERSIYAEDIMESTLAPLIDQAMLDNPCVYIKSHVYTKSNAQIEGQKSHIELHLSTTADDAKIGRNRLEEAVARLSDLVHENGGKIET
jgi:nicotinamide-nucleotide amidase